MRDGAEQRGARAVALGEGPGLFRLGTERLPVQPGRRVRREGDEQAVLEALRRSPLTTRATLSPTGAVSVPSSGVSGDSPRPATTDHGSSGVSRRSSDAPRRPKVATACSSSAGSSSSAVRSVSASDESTSASARARAARAVCRAAIETTALTAMAVNTNIATAKAFSPEAMVNVNIGGVK